MDIEKTRAEETPVVSDDCAILHSREDKKEVESENIGKEEPGAVHAKFFKVGEKVTSHSEKDTVLDMGYAYSPCFSTVNHNEEHRTQAD